MYHLKIRSLKLILLCPDVWTFDILSDDDLANAILLSKSQIPSRANVG